MLHKSPINFLLLCTVIFGILWQGGHLFWFGLATSSLVFMLSYHIYKKYHQQLLRPSGIIHLLLLAFTAWCFIVVLLSPIPYVSLYKTITTSVLLLGSYLYFLIVSNKPKAWNKLWLTLIGVGFILSIYTFVEFSLGQGTPNSLFFNKNTHAAYLNLIIIPTSAYFLLSQQKQYSHLLLASLFLMVISHALPGSRGASFGQFMAIALLLIVAWPHVSKQKIKQFSIVYLSAIGLATIATSNLFRFFAYSIEDTDLGRLEIWAGALKLLVHTPWYGNGLGTYWLLHPAFRHIDDPSSGQNAHNDYLQFLIEGGVPALLLLLLLISAITFYWIRSLKSNTMNAAHKIELTAIFGSFAAIAFHSLFSYNFGVFSILFLSGLLLGRFLYLTSATKSFHLSQSTSIKPVLFKSAQIVISSIIIIYCLRISFFSYYYQQAIDYYNYNKITKADQYASIAISLNASDTRAYILYANIYNSILKLITELTIQQQKFYILKAMEYLERAEKLNPYRTAIYLVRARLIINNHSFFKGNKELMVEQQYKTALAIDPRDITASTEYAKYLLANKQIKDAQDIVFDNIKRHKDINEATYDFYLYAYSLLSMLPNKANKDILSHKLSPLKTHFEKRQKAIPAKLKKLLQINSKLTQQKNHI